MSLLAALLLGGCDPEPSSSVGDADGWALRATWRGDPERGKRLGEFLGSPGNGVELYAGEDQPGWWCDSGCGVYDSGAAWAADPRLTGEQTLEAPSVSMVPAPQAVPLPSDACPDAPCVLFGLGKPIDAVLLSAGSTVAAFQVGEPEFGYLGAAGWVEFESWSGLAFSFSPISGDGTLPGGVHILDDWGLAGEIVTVERSPASLVFSGNGLPDPVTVNDYTADGLTDIAACFRSAEDGDERCVVAEGPWLGFRDAATADIVIRGAVAGFFAGGLAPDFDGDGYADLVLAYPESSRVAIWFGPLDAAVDFQSADATIRDTGAIVDLMMPASPGDVDGDGWPDLLVSGIATTGSGAGDGAVHVLLGPFDGDRDVDGAAMVLLAPEPGGNFGEVMVGVGDVDGDGADEFAVSDPYAGSSAGAVYIYGLVVP